MASSAWTGWPGPPRVSRMRAPTQAGSRSGPSPNPGPFSTDAPTHSEKNICENKHRPQTRTVLNGPLLTHINTIFRKFCGEKILSHPIKDAEHLNQGSRAHGSLPPGGRSQVTGSVDPRLDPQRFRTQVVCVAENRTKSSFQNKKAMACDLILLQKGYLLATLLCPLHNIVFE